MNGKRGTIPKEDIEKITQYFEIIEKEPQAALFLAPVNYFELGLDDYPKIIKKPMDISTVKNNIRDGIYSTLQEVINDIQLIWDNCKLYNIEGSDIYKMAVYCDKFTKKYVEKNIRKKTSSTNDKNKHKKKDKDKEKDTKKNENENENEKEKEKEIINDQPVSPEKKEKVERESRRKKPDTATKPIESVPVVKLESQLPLDENDEMNGEEEDQKEETSQNGLTNYEKMQLANRVKKLQNDGLASLVRLVQKECPSSIQENEDNMEIIFDLLERKTYEQINRLIDTFLKVKETNHENVEMKKNKA